MCFMFLHLYHLSFMKIRFVADVLDPSKSSPLLLGFCRSLSYREIVDITTLLSSIREFESRMGRMDVRFWSPNSTKGLSFRSFFHCLLDPSPSIYFIFILYGRRKSKER